MGLRNKTPLFSPGLCPPDPTPNPLPEAERGSRKFRGSVTASGMTPLALLIPSDRGFFPATLDVDDSLALCVQWTSAGCNRVFGPQNPSNR
jgi:hypothetical protein